MVEILVDPKSRPYIVGQFTVTRFEVARINFMQYAECYRERLKEFARTNDEMMATKAFMRARRNHQVTTFAAGAVVPMSTEQFALMPRELFTKVNAAIDNQADPKGSVISNGGDGLNKPIIYKLGTPFEYHDTKLTEKPLGTEAKIIELEFVAKTGGDIEEVLCYDNSLDQAVALIKTCATPLGGESSLLRLPTWMLAQLTLSDGFEIMSKVLPVFLE